MSTTVSTKSWDCAPCLPEENVGYGRLPVGGENEVVVAVDKGGICYGVS